MDASEKKYIIAIGANPCWEKILKFSEFTVGEVNRAASVGGYAAGKAGNFCRALKCLGGKFPGLQLTFLGGRTGEAFAEDQRREGLECEAVTVSYETRTCVNCVCNGEMTELVEPGNPPDENAVAEFLDLLKRRLPEAAAVALCGTVPAGTSSALVDGIIALLRQCRIPVLLDNWQEAEKFLAASLKLLLKINSAELKRLTGEADVPMALDALKRRYPGIIAGITDGPGRAWLITPEHAEAVAIAPRKLDLIVNPLGAGDVASAVFLARYTEGMAAEEAFTEALEAATRSCMNEIAGLF